MIQVLGDRVLVALPPTVDELVSAGGIVLVKDPDRFQTPTRGIVVALGQKNGAVDLEDVLTVVRETLFKEGVAATVMAILENVAALKPAEFDVQEGDCVLFPAGAGEEIEDGDIRYVILREAEILGVLEPITTETEAA